VRWTLAAVLCVLAWLLAARSPAIRVIELPTGVVDLHEPIAIDGSHLLVRGNGTVLRAAPGFRGRALLLCRGCRHTRFTGFTVDGNRAALAAPAGLPPSDIPFARFTPANGILVENAAGVAIDRVRFTAIAGFSVLVSASRDIRVDSVEVTDSGGRNSAGRNNTTGGILLEEGTVAFRVTGSTFTRVLGNGIWTHSLYTSPRNRDGLIARNRFHEIGRDAIQVGHATGVRVEGNTGSRIGYSLDAVDATPVAVDTAGNVDRSLYARNRFAEVNGKCIDLDGFHHGLVLRNACVNRQAVEAYPNGHFGIVVNNWNPDMRSENILLAENTIDGAKFGGIFLMGERHRVLRNRLLNLNLAHCNENAARFGCVAIQGEPRVLEAGIYLGRVAAEWAQKRAAASRGMLIEDNAITGWKMRDRCILAAPGVSLTDSTVRYNRCEDGPQRAVGNTWNPRTDFIAPYTAP